MAASAGDECPQPLADFRTPQIVFLERSFEIPPTDSRQSAAAASQPPSQPSSFAFIHACRRLVLGRFAATSL